MRPFRFHVLRFLEWLAHREAAWANARILAVRNWRERRLADAERLGKAADNICPPRVAAREWKPRLWDRNHDPRSDTRERQP